MEKTRQENGESLAATDLKDTDFRLEYYKYILQEIRSLNENTHKYLTLFQTLATAIIAGGITILVSWKSLRIDTGTAKSAIQGLLGLLILVALFMTISIIVNVVSWFDYRKEEVELLDQVGLNNFRRPPTLRNVWRWSEMYILFFIIMVVIVLCFFVEYQIIPLIK